MKGFINLMKINSLVTIRLWPTWLLLVLGTVLVTIVYVGEIDGSGHNAQFTFRVLTIPIRLFLITFSLIEGLLSIFAVITTFVLADKLLNGQFMQIYLTRFQNRATYLGAFLLTIFLLTGIGTLGYLYIFIKAGFTITHVLYAYFSILLMMYSLCLMLIALFNFTSTRVLSLPILFLLLFLVKPVLQYVDSLTGSFSLVSDFFYILGFVVTFPFRFNDFSDQLVRLGYLEASLFWYAFSILVILIVSNCIWFVRKDLVDG